MTCKFYHLGPGPRRLLIGWMGMFWSEILPGLVCRQFGGDRFQTRCLLLAVAPVFLLTLIALCRMVARSRLPFEGASIILRCWCAGVGGHRQLEANRFLD